MLSGLAIGFIFNKDEKYYIALIVDDDLTKQ